MNTFQAMNAMQNPQMYIMQQALQNMIRENPDQWSQCQQMFSGKSRDEQMAELRKIYQDRGLDLDATARQWGIRL